MIVLATILLFPGVLGMTAMLMWGLARFGLVPSRRWSALFVVGGSLYALLFLGNAVYTLILIPSRLQQDYLGEVAAGPQALVAYEESGFQDPYQIWRYALSPAQAERLRRRCQWNEGPRGHRNCVLYGAMDERWFADVSLDKNTLQMVDGLH